MNAAHHEEFLAGGAPSIAAVSDSGVLSFSVEWGELLRVVRMVADVSEGVAIESIPPDNQVQPGFFLREYCFPCTTNGHRFLLRGSSGGTPLSFRRWLIDQCAGVLFVWGGSEVGSQVPAETYDGRTMRHYRDILVDIEVPVLHLFWNLKGLKGWRLERLLQTYTDWGIPEVLPVLGGDEQALSLELGRFFDQVLA